MKYFLKVFICSLALLFVSLLFVSLGLTSTIPQAFADGVAVENVDLNINQNEYQEIGSDLRCPTCTGLSVLDSDAAFSIQIKNEVKSQLAAGKHKDEILKFFTERYGPWILRAPPAQGVHLLAWAVPIGALILGPLVLWLLVWMRKDLGTEELVSRGVEEIVTEMNQRLASMRSGHGGSK